MCSLRFLSSALPTPSLRVCASRPSCSHRLLGLSARLSLPLSLSLSHHSSHHQVDDKLIGGGGGGGGRTSKS